MNWAWKWGPRIFLGLVLLVGSVVGLAWWRAGRIFERHRLEVAAKIAALRAADHSRPSIYDETVPGNAWELDQAAFKAFKVMPEEELNAVPTMSSDPFLVPDPLALEALLEKYRPQIQQLKDGARRREVWANPPFEKSPDVPFDAGGAIRAFRFVAGMSEHLHSMGRDAEALEFIPLGLATAHDMGRGGFILNLLIQVVGEGIASEAARQILEYHCLRPADLERFSEGLRRLIAARPTIGAAWATEEIFIRQTLVNGGYTDDPLRVQKLPWARYWKYGFSRRLAQASALELLAPFFRDIGPLQSLPSHERFAAASRVMGGLSTKNPVIERMLPPLVRVYQRDSWALLQLTLLEVTTALARYEADQGRPPDRLADLVPRYLPGLPACPLRGTPLGYRPGRVWSFGWDGDDDGGRKAEEQQSEDDESFDGDVVWIVGRK